jgi:hypothetical protein
MTIAEPNDLDAPAKTRATEEGWPLFEVWSKYEEIAMHFNDLIMRLRTQALGAVAALATIIGIFARRGTDQHTIWEIVSTAFAILSIFWIAIWTIDFWYYNRLLQGAVVSLLNIEKQSKERLRIKYIDMSSTIEEGVAGCLPKNPMAGKLSIGRWAFYILVALALLGGFGFSLCQYLDTPITRAGNEPTGKNVHEPATPNRPFYHLSH